MIEIIGKIITTFSLLGVISAPVWANEGCNEYLENPYLEISMARAENRSLLLAGKISQVQYERRIEELNEKAKGLSAYGPAPELSDVSHVSKEDREEIFMPVELKEVLEYIDDENRIWAIDYDPKYKRTLLTRVYNGLVKKPAFLVDGKELSESITPPIKWPIVLSSFWGPDPSKLIMYVEGKSYLYDIATKTSVDMGLESEGIWFNVSPRGTWFYPVDIDSNSNRLQIKSTNLPYQDHALNGLWTGHARGVKKGKKLSFSGNENYLLAQCTVECKFFEANGPLIQKEPIKMEGGSDEVKACGVIPGSSTGFMLTDRGFYYKELMPKNVIRSVPAVIEPHERVDQAEVSPDGRFIAFLTTNKNDEEPIKYLNIFDTALLEYAYAQPIDFVYKYDELNLGFSRDSSHFFMYSNFKANVYQLQSGPNEVVK